MTSTATGTARIFFILSLNLSLQKETTKFVKWDHKTQLKFSQLQDHTIHFWC